VQLHMQRRAIPCVVFIPFPHWLVNVMFSHVVYEMTQSKTSFAWLVHNSPYAPVRPAQTGPEEG
jgi:hypothetical protein